MWQNYKLYLMALGIYTVATAALVALEVAATLLGDSALLARLVTMLSGNLLGGFALVLGILRDDRVEKEKQRAAAAIADWQKRAESERNRADRAEAELQRVRTEYNREMADRIRRLEAAVGIMPAPPATVADDDRSDRPAAP